MSDMIKVTLLGDVDHGKSTLIGRLLQQFSVVHKALQQGNLASSIDGLTEEQERLLTLDTAQAVVQLGARRLVLIDVPGHFELLHNMLTGASQANAALLVVDATRGFGAQTRRHLALLELLGLRCLVVACNKMDAIGYCRESLMAIADPLCAFAATLGLKPAAVVPISALHGENIITRSAAMAWYEGPTLVKALERLLPYSTMLQEVRFIIQDRYVLDGAPVYVGRVEAGILRLCEYRLLPAGYNCLVTAIERFGEPPLFSANVGDCVGVRLAPDPAASTGDVLTSLTHPASVGDQVRARIVHFGQHALNVNKTLRCRMLGRDISSRLTRIEKCFDSDGSQPQAANVSTLNFSEIARVEMKLENKITYDKFSDVPAMGRFVLWNREEVTAAGIIEGSA